MNSLLHKQKRIDSLIGSLSLSLSLSHMLHCLHSMLTIITTMLEKEIFSFVVCYVVWRVTTPDWQRRQQLNWLEDACRDDPIRITLSVTLLTCVATIVVLYQGLYDCIPI
jgi:hypothetical protein